MSLLIIPLLKKFLACRHDSAIKTILKLLVAQCLETRHKNPYIFGHDPQIISTKLSLQFNGFNTPAILRWSRSPLGESFEATYFVSLLLQ